MKNKHKQTSGRSVDDFGNIKTYSTRMQTPQFTGGFAAFGNYLSKNIKYPAEAKKAKIYGKVILSFTVNTDGSIEEIKVLSSPSPYLSNEAERVIAQSPSWQPATYFGIPVRVKYSVPINFNL